MKTVGTDNSQSESVNLDDGVRGPDRRNTQDDGPRERRQTQDVDPLARIHLIDSAIADGLMLMERHPSMTATDLHRALGLTFEGSRQVAVLIRQTALDVEKQKFIERVIAGGEDHEDYKRG